MFVTPRKRGREEATRICPLIPAFAGMARSYCGRSRARIVATDGQAQQRRTGIVTVTIEELRMDQGVEPHAAATASCQRAVASARKALSVDREMMPT